MGAEPIRTRAVAVALAACASLTACGMLPGFNASISVSGTVRGEDGRVLEGVELHVRESRFDLRSESFSSIDTREFQLADGRFDFACWKCSGATLRFRKPGYYSETLRLHVDKEVESSGRFAREVAQDLDERDLEVVLRSDANQAKLVSYEARLQSTARGPVRVAPLRVDLGSNGVRVDRLDQPPSREAHYLPGYVQLIAAVDSQGELAAEPLPDVPGARMRFPMPPVLDFGPADGGISLYRHAQGNQAEIYREMRTAPANGYVETLVLDPPERGGAHFFYFKIGDRYGKGMVASPSFDHVDGVEVVGVYVELRLNESGEPNVETAR